MDISIVGAGGNVGRHIVLGLIQLRILGTSDRLQIVGNRGGKSGVQVLGMKEDLLDAYAEYAPEIDVAGSFDEVVGDIIVVAAGQPATPEHPERDFLAKANLPIFRRLGRHLYMHGSGHELVLVFTNPVELGTLVIARELEDPARVIGMGSYLDSHRFRKELATRWGLYHGDVDAMMLGEHGHRCLPIWSSVTIRGRSKDYVDGKVAELKTPVEKFWDSRDAAVGSIKKLIASEVNDIEGALAALEGATPDVRAAVLPMICQASGAKTAVGTADKICRLLSCLVDGRQERIPVQTCLSLPKEGGMVLGFDTCMGVPALLSMNGIAAQPDLAQFDDDEAETMRKTAALLSEKLDKWMVE